MSAAELIVLLVQVINVRRVFFTGELVGIFFGGEVSYVIKFVCLDPVHRAKRPNLNIKAMLRAPAGFNGVYRIPLVFQEVFELTVKS